MASRTQAQDARTLYDERAAVYDDSWHPRFAAHMIQLLKLKPGESVLDLACGTGLVTYQASKAVGPSGTVIGVDVSSGMLAQAHKKQLSHPLNNISIYQHSITELDTLDAVANKHFDVISCISAFVLLAEPATAMKQWCSYLKPGGRLIVDVTHARNHLPGIVLEKVGDILHRPIPSHRLLFQEPKDLRECMVEAGLTNIEMVFMSQLESRDGSEKLDAFVRDLDDPRVSKTYKVGEADDVFDKWIDHAFTQCLGSDKTRGDARDVFKEEWSKLADANGDVVEIDGVYVAIGWKR